MIKVFEKKDLRKFALKKSFDCLIQSILCSYDYLEFSDGDTFFLPVKDKSHKEIICFSSEEKSQFLRDVRDNYQSLVSSVKKKNILDKVYSNIADRSNPLHSRILDLKIKTPLQLLNFSKKIQHLNKRLQNVFVINESFKKIARTFDNSNVLMLFPNFTEEFESVLKDVKEAKVLLFLREKKIPYKKLKVLGLTNLSYKRESTKHVWLKNIDLSQIVDTQHK